MKHFSESSRQGCSPESGIDSLPLSEQACSTCGMTSCPMAGSQAELDSPDLRRGPSLAAWAGACFVLPVLIAIFAASMGDSPETSVALALVGFLGTAGAVATLAPKPAKR